MENKDFKLTICIFAFVIGVVVLFCCIGLGEFSAELLFNKMVESWILTNIIFI
ncbi:hypothetical protein QJK86_14735 [Clostridioides difficile]|nr:hypothetical protein [Clostridioides difficile]